MKQHLRNIVAFMCFAATRCFAGELSEIEQEGRNLYFTGSIPGQPTPNARIGAEGTIMPASMTPCAGCHGDDGRGRPEGGVIPPDITWRNLTNGAGRAFANGRRHGPFTDQTIAAAVMQGVDPAGNELDAIMPRYVLSQAQMVALTSYLKVIEADQAPGVSADGVIVAVALPLSGPRSEIGQRVKTIIASYIERLNATGGIYNRRIRLEFIDTGGAVEETIDRVESILRSRSVFMLLNADPSLTEIKFETLADQVRTPLISPLPSPDQNDPPQSHFSFFLFSGVKTNARALIDYAASRRDLAHARAAIVYPDTPELREASSVVTRQAYLHAWPQPMSFVYTVGRFDAQEAASQLKSANIQLVVFFGAGDDLDVFMSAAEAQDWRPYFLATTPVVERSALSMPPALANRVLLAFPVLPSGWSPGAAADFARLRNASPGETSHLASQLAAYCSVQLLAQGLKNAGRDLSTSRFVSALDGLRDFETGLTRPLSFDPAHRVGAPGAYIARIDAASHRVERVSEWIEPIQNQH